MNGADVIVVGAGIVGCAVAHALTRIGCSVLIVERDQPAAHASGVAAGMLAPFTESLGEGPLLDAGARALEALPAAVADARAVSGIDPELAIRGILRVAFEDERADLRARAATLGRFGVRWIDRDDAGALVPGLAPQIVGALWSPAEGQLDPGRFTRALLGAALAGGAQIEVGLPVHGLLTHAGRARGVRTPDGPRAADAVVLCAGPWTGVFEEAIGASIPVEPVRGQLIELDDPEPAAGPIVWGRGAYLVGRSSGTILVGATVERVGFESAVTAGGIRDLLAGAAELLPASSRWHFRSVRAGLRPATPDGIPIVGPSPTLDGVWLATGHYRNGVLLAHSTGEAIARAVQSGKLPPGLDSMDPGRFARI